jgi:hypothetical protein
MLFSGYLTGRGVYLNTPLPVRHVTYTQWVSYREGVLAGQSPAFRAMLAQPGAQDPFHSQKQ